MLRPGVPHVKAAACERRNFTLSIASDDRQRKMIDTGTIRLPWAGVTVPLADDR
jgi:hypothetical protein